MMTEISVNNKRIAKNTLFLYFRMLLTMGVALYTSRVALQVLGVSDYGLYNVVGGVVAMLAFINGSMSSGTSRFIAYELGRNNVEKMNQVFNVSLVCHILIALICFVLAETVGLWFLNTYIQFPANRLLAVWLQLLPLRYHEISEAGREEHVGCTFGKPAGIFPLVSRCRTLPECSPDHYRRRLYSGLGYLYHDSFGK